MKRSKVKPLPCPFCGSADIGESKNDAQRPPQWLFCRNCGCEGPLPPQRSSINAGSPAGLENWNTRYEQPDAKLKEILYQLAQMTKQLSGISARLGRAEGATVALKGGGK